MIVIVLSEEEKFYNLVARSLIMFLSGPILHKMTPTPDLVTCSDGGIRKQEERVINGTEKGLLLNFSDQSSFVLLLDPEVDLTG